ncbi:MAG: hypothetical protein ACI9O6_000746 [Glaciecola sp.]|jgi:hypothetical protein
MSNYVSCIARSISEYLIVMVILRSSKLNLAKSIHKHEFKTAYSLTAHNIIQVALKVFHLMCHQVIHFQLGAQLRVHLRPLWRIRYQ